MSLPPKKEAEVLISRQECDLILETEFLQTLQSLNEVISVGSHQCDCGPIKRQEIWTQTEMHTGRKIWEDWII